MKFKLLISNIVFILIIFFGCETVKDEILGPEPIPGSAVSAGVTLNYVIDENDLHCTLRANTVGWIAVGFNPSSMMNEANFIIGYVENDNGFIRDDWGISNTTHSSDLVLGGSEDIILINAYESEGITELEFKIPLDSGDQYDQALEINQTYPIILAHGDDDDFDSYHTAAGLTEITLESN